MYQLIASHIEPFSGIVGTDAATDVKAVGEGSDSRAGSYFIAGAQHYHVAPVETIFSVDLGEIGR